MFILGISSFYHDSAAALIYNGKIIAAAQEERFSRIKHDSTYPTKAIAYVLNEAQITLSQIESVVFYEKPFLKFERILESHLESIPYGLKTFCMAMPIWLREKLFLKKILLNELRKNYNKFKFKNLYFAEHHFSHAASAFYPSPFDEAIILTLDGVGEWATSTISIGKGSELNIVKEMNFPHSLGLLYSAFTYYLGFKVNSGEYKLMGLAPYGKPLFKDKILNNLISLKKDGSFKLNQKYFNYVAGLTMTNKKFDKLFDNPIRKNEEEKITQFHMDIAASIQSVTEEIIIKIITQLSKDYNISNLCLAGGVALNCVANGKIIESKKFKNIWIQPAAGDAGGAVGCALSLWYKEFKNKRKIDKYDSMQGSYLGPKFTKNEIKNILDNNKANYKILSEDDILLKTALEISKGKTVGWFQGRMEFGPRALGNRSILADPRNEKMQKILNLKIKYRESFRPFAPSVLYEDLNQWFKLDFASPYMLIVADLLDDKKIKMTDKQKKEFGINKLNIKKSEVPAITHVNYSARIQTVHKNTNPKYYNLIKEFKQITNCGMLINTSFNIRGEPIVLSPLDAFKCFMGTDLDILVIENFYLIKENQFQTKNNDYKNSYKLD